VAKPFDGGSGTVACSDGTVAWTPAKVWPPNHKMKDVTITYDEASDDGDTLTVTIDSITHDDEGLEKGSTANHFPDDAGEGLSGSASDDAGAAPATVTGQVRKERMGKDKDGRVYTISVTCTDAGDVSGEGPTSGTASLTVTVPHDRRK